MEIEANKLREILFYNHETGEWRWLVKRTGKNNNNIAGHINKLGYRIIKINNKAYKAHRLAFIYMTGNEPIGFVDHKDGNPSNNKWDNLRQCSNGQNIQNSKIRIDNKTGYKGVYIKRERNGKIMYGVRIASKYMGRYDTPEKAHFEYCKLAEQKFQEFARVK